MPVHHTSWAIKLRVQGLRRTCLAIKLDAMQQPSPVETYHFHSKRDREETNFFELYRCYDVQHELYFSARSTRFGKPVPIFVPGQGSGPIAEIRNRKGYLVNGRTDIRDLRSGELLGSYSRVGRVYDATDEKAGAWRDARSWSEEFKVNIIDAIGNALLGSGDVPGGANHGDTHLLTMEKTVLAVLQRARLPFFPDPPRRTEPGRFARMASKVVPGELGKSLAEVRPPYGWTLTVQNRPGSEEARALLLYCALFRIEFLRWSRTS